MVGLIVQNRNNLPDDLGARKMRPPRWSDIPWKIHLAKTEFFVSRAATPSNDGKICQAREIFGLQPVCLQEAI
jgi:hypothetical protein